MWPPLRFRVGKFVISFRRGQFSLKSMSYKIAQVSGRVRKILVERTLSALLIDSFTELSTDFVERSLSALLIDSFTELSTDFVDRLKSLNPVVRLGCLVKVILELQTPDCCVAASNGLCFQPLPLALAYLTRIPGCAPESGDSRKMPGALPVVSEAAKTMPSDIPNFILRGARLATITVRRPINWAGS